MKLKVNSSINVNKKVKINIMTTSLTNDVSYKTLTEKAFTCKDSKRLSITSPTFERHPSASKLLNVTEAKDPLAFVIENEKNKSPSSAPFPYHFTIELYETDNPLYEKSETFYIKNENVSQNEKKNKNCINAKPLFLSLTPQQIELDEKITTSIQKENPLQKLIKYLQGVLLKIIKMS